MNTIKILSKTLNDYNIATTKSKCKQKFSKSNKSTNKIKELKIKNNKKEYIIASFERGKKKNAKEIKQGFVKVHQQLGYLNNLQAGVDGSVRATG